MEENDNNIVHTILVENKKRNKQRNPFDQYRLEIRLSLFVIVVYHMLYSFKKTNDYIAYQNIAIQLQKNKNNNSLIFNQKSFKTIHGMIGQSIRDKECSIKYK